MHSVIAPLRAIRYNSAASRDLSGYICPPYDIISEGMGGDLRARHELNFVRLELPQPRGGGSDQNSRYSRAAEALHDWLARGVLVRDREPALYLLEQEFELGYRRWRRRGLFALVRLPEPGEQSVLSHEGTLAGPKADRLHLMQACRAMTSPIMLMCEDAGRELLGLLEPRSGEPEITATDLDGVAHRMWALRDRPAVDALRAAVAEGPLFIADGHHRFETALTHREEMRREHPGAPAEAAFNYALAFIVSTRDPGLKILPTHRLISGLGPEGVAAIKAEMHRWFDVHRWPLPDADELAGQPWLESAADDRHVYGAYCADGSYYVLTAREEVLAPSPSVVAGLDVSVLHRHLIDPVLSQLGGSPEIAYVIDAHDAALAVARHEYDFAFFLRPTRVAEVLAAARTSERMPGKSTYFYPKAPAGFVLSDASVEPI